MKAIIITAIICLTLVALAYIGKLDRKHQQKDDRRHPEDHE